LEFGPGEKEAEIFARGLRNSVGLALHPDTGELWGSDNGRDMLGDDLPPEEINLIRKGSDYGWPYCYGNRTPDPKYDRPDRCKDTTPPQVTMQAHSAPLGIAFGKGLNFPETFQKMLFVGFHGSWNRSVPTGYKLVGIPFEEGRPVGGPVDIISGWLEGRTAWGRPVGPLVGPDGALYLSDDRTGAVYRIWFPERQ
ncbi:MAG TPA: PQQ-dependent sugar dehydrogenase, partial [Desulfuromonadales bacterium]|nr:PQQ-dependent sugar dehydrogenase [Desulfuromonadales bacterium]